MGRKEYRSRFEKRKQNRVLNIAIGVVLLLIVVVGASIFINGGSSQTSSSNHSADKKDQSSSVNKDSNKNDDSSIAVEDKNASEAADENKDASKKEDSEDKDKEAADKEKSEDKAKGGPEGPWDPVGTSQTGEHTKSYDKGSSDWSEQTKALSYASGIPEDQMTILWLGNGGGPDKSVGRVLSKADGSRYEVQLQWEDGKGWKPTSVKKQ
ncbi:YrrS family protein [Fictibacillus enclensis]|uniref:YrrS family protein n=1 Tax=Fictibacillus enclensis TaxID=1017270 RepID=UPI0025A01773|nr:YrrS family protein [Fictibacillus enclensis]MDM5339203.1 YrrS family protein [Fictibacillus enclensis]